MFKRTIAVSRVVDGDTFICEKGKRYRLYLIDAPEYGQPFAQESTKLLSSLILRKRIKIRIKSTDKYKRKIVQCFIGSTDVNALLLKHGLARLDNRFIRSTSHGYTKIEDIARKKRVGMWSKKHVAPWDYRAKKKARIPRLLFLVLPATLALVALIIITLHR